MHLIWFRILLLYTAYPFLSSLSSPKSLVAFFDGGSKLSRAASGIVLCSVTNTSSILPLSWNESDISVDFGYAFYFGSINSSLAAEYLSVIEALHLIKTSIFDDLNINEVYLLGDSSNVITSLLNQQSKFQDPLISSYSCVAKGILNSISECVPVHLSHIPRARNHVADSLCDICLEMKRPLHAAYRNNSETKYSWVLNDIKLNRMLSYYNKDENKNEKYSKLLVFKINTSTGALTSSTKQLLNDLKLRIVLSTLNITLFYDLLQPSGEIALPFSYSKSKLSDINIQYSLCIGTENRVISEIMNTTITATNTFKTADKQELINESASTVVDVSLIDNPIVGVQIGVSVTDPSDILSLACDTSSNVPSTYTVS